MLYLAGADLSRDLAGELRGDGFDVRARVERVGRELPHALEGGIVEADAPVGEEDRVGIRARVASPRELQRAEHPAQVLHRDGVVQAQAAPDLLDVLRELDAQSYPAPILIVSGQGDVPSSTHIQQRTRGTLLRKVLHRSV